MCALAKWRWPSWSARRTRRSTEADVIAFCRGKVASFKLPRHVVFIDAFPMTASGKIRKVELREEAKRLLLPAREAAS